MYCTQIASCDNLILLFSYSGNNRVTIKDAQKEKLFGENSKITFVPASVLTFYSPISLCSLPYRLGRGMLCTIVQVQWPQAQP